ncbi:O-acetylhomoserine aminocarboxypropyltransferase/cysteine synthase [Siculibacillus lacustris]|uniref:O-acetylhomoserine aminocarboxypropyltransferase/cysteine synthase n=1 Tax=Siculibacillus lacustris TaxID=1549641 RepID=A0A4Q9VXS8_9HYPH|nr:PLP-dependent transferase [Siculibacillus lacustris]TBW41297.1 O-acetylhomoserine aminocarboxypropyltransferase/cysteine synthase [Siculibacillus lacustris]
MTIQTPTADRLHADTLVLHGGSYRSDPATAAVAVPIYQTTSFQFESTAKAARVARLEEIAFTYSRVANPTVDAFERRLAALEGGVAALALGSGQAAVAFAVLALLEAGDNIVTSDALYGGSVNLFRYRLAQFGIEARFVDPTDPDAFRRATDDRTRLYFGEALANPKLTVFPIREVAEIGRPLGIPLIIDNTATPLTVRPFDHGAAVVVYSATKYIGGHGTTIGGAIIDSGTFPWSDFPERQPAINRPDPSYGDRSWNEIAERFGPIAYVLRTRATLLRDFGATLAAQSAFQLIQGLETLPLRIARHNENAIRVADHLAAHPKVARVVFPGLQQGEERRRADTYLQGGWGALIGFEHVDGADAAKRFIDALELIYHLANIGDARSLAVHPASTIHAQLSEAEQLAAGVTPGFVRLSIGIERIDDILRDIDRALARS